MAERNANIVLFSLIAAAILFLIFLGVSTLSSLGRHAYVPEAGWQQPPVSSVNDSSGNCEYKPEVTNGFPLAYSREAELPYTCLKASNFPARALDYALYFALAAVIAAPVAKVLEERHG